MIIDHKLLHQNTYNRQHIAYTILAGAAVGEIIDLGTACLIGMMLGAGFDGNELAFEGGGWLPGVAVAVAPLYDAADQEITVAYDNTIAQYIDLDFRHFHSVRFLRITTRTDGAQTAQTAERTIRLIVA
jgi:hypothetical protein